MRSKFAKTYRIRRNSSKYEKRIHQIRLGKRKVEQGSREGTVVFGVCPISLVFAKGCCRDIKIFMATTSQVPFLWPRELHSTSIEKSVSVRSICIYFIDTEQPKSNLLYPLRSLADLRQRQRCISPTRASTAPISDST
jgi:hypothetical protein